jgi:hypothetical protein
MVVLFDSLAGAAVPGERIGSSQRFLLMQRSWCGGVRKATLRSIKSWTRFGQRFGQHSKLRVGKRFGSNRSSKFGEELGGPRVYELL